MISAVVLAKNEEQNLEACLKTLPWCDELIVVDDYSQDKTVAIAQKQGARVFRRRLAGDFAAQRNFGLRKATGDWVLFIDADERVSPRLTAEIREQISKNKHQGFNIRRIDFWGSRWLKHGETANIRLLRLARRGSGFWQRQVHEFWNVKGSVAELKNPLLHYPHQNLTAFLRHINFYSSLHAEAFYKQGRRPTAWRVFCNPLGKFLVNWIFRCGFRDGTAGLMVALTMSLHSFLAWGKLYLKWKK